MAKFCMNSNYPNDGPNGLRAYHDGCFLLIDETSKIVSLDSLGGGDIIELNSDVIKSLKEIQNQGYEICGEVPSFWPERVDIQGDCESFRSLLSHESDLLEKLGIKLKHF